MKTDKAQLVLQKAIKEIMKQNSNCWKEHLSRFDKSSKIIKALRQEVPEGWVPLRLAVSCYLTQGTRVDNLDFPTNKNEWVEIWKEIKPQPRENKRQLEARFKKWIKNRGNHRGAEKFSKAYGDYWQSRKWDLGNSLQDLKELENADTMEEVRAFWRGFNWVGEQYSKNIPMEEKDKRFNDNIKVDSRLKGIIKELNQDKLSNLEIEQFFLSVSREIGLTGWETDRFCFSFYKEIKKEIKKIKK